MTRLPRPIPTVRHKEIKCLVPYAHLYRQRAQQLAIHFTMDLACLSSTGLIFWRQCRAAQSSGGDKVNRPHLPVESRPDTEKIIEEVAHFVGAKEEHAAVIAHQFCAQTHAAQEPG